MTKFVGQEPAKVEIQPGVFKKLMLVGIQGTGKTTSAVTSWITSPFQTAIDNRAGTPAVGTRGAQTPLQSRVNSLFGTGSPASGQSTALNAGAGTNSVLLYGGLALLAFALLKRR